MFGRERTVNLYLSGDLNIKADVKLAGELVIRPPTPAPQPIRCVVTTRIDGISVTGEGGMAYNLPVGRQVNVQVAYVDQAGNAAEIDGDVTWTSSDDTIALVHSMGPTQAVVMAGSVLGQAQITAEADADVGDGVKSLMTPFDVTVVAGEAVAGVISPVGESEPIPR